MAHNQEGIDPCYDVRLRGFVIRGRKRDNATDHGGRNDQRENELFHGPAFDLVGQGPANCRALSIYVQDPGWPYRRSSWTSANNRVWDCGAGFRKVLCGVLGPMARLIQDPCRPSRVMGLPTIVASKKA